MPCWTTRWCLPRSCETWASPWVWRWWRTCLMASSAYHSSPRRRRSHQKSAWSKWGGFFSKKTRHLLFANDQSWKRLIRAPVHQGDLYVILWTEKEIWHNVVREMQYLKEEEISQRRIMRVQHKLHFKPKLHNIFCRKRWSKEPLKTITLYNQH